MNSPQKIVINGQAPQKPHGNGGGNNRNTFRTLLIVFIALVISLLGLVAFVLIDISKIWSDPGDGGIVAVESEENVEGLPEVSFEQGEVTAIDKQDDEVDIMMIGVDNRDNKFTGRSDVMMYLRVNMTDKTIKMVSFMRDTLVGIDGHDKNKLNTAYGFGGIDLMYDTFKKSFGLEPDYYIVVNFYGMEDIVNAMDGVDVEIKSEELEWLNININEINTEDPKGKAANINDDGVHHLNGRQAVAYMRIRHPGYDQGRIARQQTVMFKLFEKAKNVSMGQIPDLISTMTQYVRTDMPINKMIDLASAVRGMDNANLTTFRYPEKCKNGWYGSMSVVQPENFNEEFQKLYDFLND